MASSLPQELLSLIANHITGKKEKLTPYTLVNKSWQAAFERRIYSSLVVLIPSDVDYITVGPTEQHKKRGLSLSRLDDITDGPQDWRQARRTYIRHILYRVAVPHYLEECRRGDDDYTYDNIWHRENNLAFSHGMRALFDYLPRLADQAISLDIALQADTAYFDEEDIEPDTLPIEVGYGTDLAPYCANFLPDWRLAASKCVRALEFLDIILPADVPSEYRGYSENKISPPAILRIASACVALQKVKVDGACISCEESDLRLDMRIATASGLSELPKSIRSLEISWSLPGSYEISEVRSLNESTEQDLLCIALHKVSLQLQDLVIFDMAVCPVLFCPDGLPGSAEVYWPKLETLDLDQIDDVSPSGALSRYGDGSSSEEVLIKHYIDDLHTSLGYATQRMPRLKNAKVELRSIDHELKVLFQNGQWILCVRVKKHYTPSSRFLEAWRVPGGCLQPCKGRGWQQASYTT